MRIQTVVSVFLASALSFAAAITTASAATITDLGSPGGFSQAFGINDAGQVVGGSSATGGIHTFLYSDGTMTDLGTFGGAFAYATAINNAGQVVGWSDIAFYTDAFLYSGGVMTDLGNLGAFYSSANGINASGQIVGEALIPEQNIGNDSEMLHAFLYTNGSMIDLNSLLPANSGWQVLSSATAINDSGQIVGYG